ETEEEFQHTLNLLEEVRFDVVHVAMYSPRPGTLSFKWEDDVPHEIKKQRLHAVEELQERIARELNAPYEGQTVEVLVEQHQVGNGQHQWRGRTRTDELVFFPAAKPLDEHEDTAPSVSGPARRRVAERVTAGLGIGVDEAPVAQV